MMGTKARLFTPIAVLSLDELLPANHFYRHLDRVVDLSFVRGLTHAISRKMLGHMVERRGIQAPLFVRWLIG